MNHACVTCGRRHKLSKRESQVYFMLARGATVSEIAEKVFLSVKTISTYRARLLEKFELRNNAELVQHAIANRIVAVELLPVEHCIDIVEHQPA